MGLYRRPDSDFWWYRLEGTKIRRSTGIPHTGSSPRQSADLERQALDLYVVAKAHHAKIAAGLVPQGKPPITFRAYADWYETHVLAHRRSADKGRSMLRRLVLGFGPCLLTAIDKARVREWMTARRATGIKPATVNRELDVLKAMLQEAVPKYLDASPLGEVRRFRVPEAERRILTLEEETRLLDAADPEMAALIITAIDTLLRLSSVVQLQWPQVKADSIVPLNAKVSHDAVPITSRMRDALKPLRAETGYVFPSFHRHRTGGATAAKNKVIRRFEDLCQRAHVPHGRDQDGVTFHCLRHTGASRALQRGASLRSVMKLGGWKDIRSVLRYLHASDVDVRLAAESIGARDGHVS